MLPFYDKNNVIFYIAFSNKTSHPKMFFYDLQKVRLSMTPPSHTQKSCC